MLHHGRPAVMVQDCTQIIADCGRQDEAQANARLIAAAPDLLAALQDLLVSAERECVSGSSSSAIYDAHAAIAKATGAP